MRLRDPGLLRLLAFEYDECALCGSVKALHLHHVLFRSHGGDDVRANIVPLCQRCHEGVHRGEKTDLFAYIRAHRPDIVEYLQGQLGKDAANARFDIRPWG